MNKRIKFPCPQFQVVWSVLLALLLALLGSTRAQAGLTMEMDLIQGNYAAYYYGNNNYFYYFSPNLGTNTSSPAVPFGDYYVSSPGWPTNGAAAYYHYDTNGFNQVGGYPWAFGDFDSTNYSSSFIQNITNGLWSIFVTNSVTTNVYYFHVTATIDSNSLPQVVVTYPTNTAANIPSQPTFTWSGPTNYGGIVIYQGSSGVELPATQTSYSGLTLLDGFQTVNVHYDLFTNGLVISSVPLDQNSHPLSSWVSTAHFQDYGASQFTVGNLDPSGTGHALVAWYTWDNTNADGSAAGTDSSGNGYDLNFSGSFGSYGGVNWTTTAEAGPGAIQFHNGDYNSGGYVGSNPTPTNVLAALAGSFSISCWVNTTQYFDYGGDEAFYGAGIVSAYTGGLANDVVPLALTGNQVAFTTGGDEDDTLTSRGSINDGNYHHVVISRNQLTGQKIVYLDGVLDNFGAGTTNLLNDSQLLTIGSLADATDPNAADANYYNGYDGILDDLQIYSGVLSSNEVSYLYNHPGQAFTIPTSGSSSDDFNAALGTTNLIWTTAGDATWFTETNVTYDGVSAAQSGTLQDNQQSVLETTVTGPCIVSFWWQTLCDNSGFDLVFAIDGVNQNDLYGQNLWNQQSYPVDPGPHTLFWTAYSSNGNSPTNAGWVDEVSVTPTTFIQFNATPLSGVVPLTVQFTSPNVDSAGNTVTNWYWDFGDGNTSTSQNPSHTYTDTGGFQPTLVAYSSNNQPPLVADGPGYISVTNPVISITASPLVGTVPLTVQFTSPSRDSASNAIVAWSWNFGDNGTSSAQNPSHTYTSTGHYHPYLEASSASVVAISTFQIAIDATKPDAITNLPGSLTAFNFNNFSNASSFQFNGVATNLITSDGPVVELTPSLSGQAGSAFIASPVPFDASFGFSTFFKFRMHNYGGIAPADGMTFTIQSDSGFDLGGGGGELGYYGIPSSFCLAFDVYNDGTLYGNPGDPSNNFIGVNFGGALNNAYFANITNSPLSDGNIWYVWIDYAGLAQDMQVRLSESPTRPSAPTLDATVNLAANLGSTNAYVGFTGATGGGWQQQDILTWQFKVVPGTAEPLTILNPRISGTNLVFDFNTVASQSYTVWANTNLATTHWITYTNVTGLGTPAEITAPASSPRQNFFRLSSP